MIVVNGPIRHELGFNAQGGAFGPGFRPNATVARAIGLIARNAFGIRPHVLEQATQGLPGRWSICLAGNEEESPWPPFAADGGLPAGTSAVSATLLRTCEFVDNRHTPDPEHVLRRAGKNGLRGIARFADADTSGDGTFSRILPSPRRVPIVVAGARNAAISMVVRVFGEWSGAAIEVSK
jgi:hypothetical protein